LLRLPELLLGAQAVLRVLPRSSRIPTAFDNPAQTSKHAPTIRRGGLNRYRWTSASRAASSPAIDVEALERVAVVPRPVAATVDDARDRLDAEVGIAERAVAGQRGRGLLDVVPSSALPLPESPINNVVSRARCKGAVYGVFVAVFALEHGSTRGASGDKSGVTTQTCWPQGSSWARQPSLCPRHPPVTTADRGCSTYRRFVPGHTCSPGSCTCADLGGVVVSSRRSHGDVTAFHAMDGNPLLLLGFAVLPFALGLAWAGRLRWCAAVPFR
jgi:hypothetical protein